MKKKLPVIIGLICICIFASFYAHVNKAHPIYDNDVDTAVYQSMGLLSSEAVIHQRFICIEESLDGFYLKTDVVGDCDDITLIFTVRDVEKDTVLSKNELSADGLKSRKLNYFKIDSVKGYNGRRLELCIEQKNAQVGSGIGFYIQPGEGQEEGAYVDGNAQGGTLVMKYVSERFDTETFLVSGFFCSFIWVFLWFLYRLFR